MKSEKRTEIMIEDPETVNGEKPDRSEVKKKNLRWFFVFVLVSQVMVFLFLIRDFSIRENQNIMLLETPIIRPGFEDPEDIRISAEDIIDTVTLMTGPETMGRSDENILRKNMVYDTGQMMWLLLKEQIGEDSELIRYASVSMSSRDFEQFKKNIGSDDILNFFYDMAAEEEAFITNWREVGVNELKASPILPWKKKVDFVVISGFDPGHRGGLIYLTRINPGLPVFCPPITRTTVLNNMEVVTQVHNLVPLPPGYTPLTGKVGAYVATVAEPGQKDPVYELDLVIQVEGGVALLTGPGFPEPSKLVDEVQRATGQKVVCYIGGTNLSLGLEDPLVEADLKKINGIAPDMIIYPNYNTSILGHKLLKEVFGHRYKKTPVGLKIRLNQIDRESGQLKEDVKKEEAEKTE